MGFALVIFLMTCWWYANKYLENVLSRKMRLPPILRTLAEDGVVYFLV